MVEVFVREHSGRPVIRIFVVIRFVFQNDYVDNLVDNLEYVGGRVINLVPSRSFTVVGLFTVSLDGVFVFLLGIVDTDFEITLGTGRFVLTVGMDDDFLTVDLDIDRRESPGDEDEITEVVVDTTDDVKDVDGILFQIGPLLRKISEILKLYNSK